MITRTYIVTLTKIGGEIRRSTHYVEAANHREAKSLAQLDRLQEDLAEGQSMAQWVPTVIQPMRSSE
jgi:hypothetical protein